MTSSMTVNRIFSSRWVWFIITLVAIGLLTALGPTEKTLGSNARLVYLHGAWVWTGILSFLLASLTGLLALILRKPIWRKGNLALGRTGMVFWLTYLPMSLLVMQINWGGFFFDEPRWRVPFTFAIVGLLLQIGLALFSQPDLTAVGNLVFGVTLWISLRNTGTILHPDSPILNSNSRSIQVFFFGLLFLTLIAAAQIAGWWFRRTTCQTNKLRSQQPK